MGRRRSITRLVADKFRVPNKASVRISIMDLCLFLMWSSDMASGPMDLVSVTVSYRYGSSKLRQTRLLFMASWLFALYLGRVERLMEAG